jgi:hypothetical protein
MAERAPDPEPLDRLEEAIVFAMRRAAAKRREADVRRAKMRSVKPERGAAA